MVHLSGANLFKTCTTLRPSACQRPLAKQYTRHAPARDATLRAAHRPRQDPPYRRAGSAPDLVHRLCRGDAHGRSRPPNAIELLQSCRSSFLIPAVELHIERPRLGSNPGPLILEPASSPCVTSYPLYAPRLGGFPFDTLLRANTSPLRPTPLYTHTQPHPPSPRPLGATTPL